MIEKLKLRCIELSTHKFSSNVVERCLIKGTTAQQAYIMDQIMRSSDKIISTLIKDSFANYVVQKAISIAKNTKNLAFTERIKEVALTIKKPNNYSKCEF